MYNLEGRKSEVKKSSKTDIAIICGGENGDGDLDDEKGKKVKKLRTVLEKAIIEL